jgi:hypothetical protein
VGEQYWHDYFSAGKVNRSTLTTSESFTVLNKLDLKHKLGKTVLKLMKEDVFDSYH